MKTTIKQIIISAGAFLLLSCQKDSLVPEPAIKVEDNEAVVSLMPEDGSKDGLTKSSLSGHSGTRTIADMSEITGIEGLVLQESVSGIYAANNSLTKGTPATDANFAVLYKNGFKAFDVYAGSTSRSDLAATFTRKNGENVWTHLYEKKEWPKDNNLRYYFSAPDVLPSYIAIERTADATESAKSLVVSIKGNYPLKASEQKDLLFAGNDIKIVRGGTSNNSVNFHHVFTAVKVKPGNTGGKFNITGVTLKGMPASGTCTITFANGMKSSDCSVWTHPETIPVCSDFTLSPVSDEAFFCIPKTFHTGDGSKLMISYTVNGVKSETAEIDLSKVLDGKSWLAGQLYTYTLTITDLGVSITDVVRTASSEDVKVTNTGNASGYLRVAMNADWVKKTNDGSEIILLKGCNLDKEGSFTGLAKQNWIRRGNYYYYRYPVKQGASAAETLFDKYAAPAAPQAGSYLQFTLMAQIVPFESSKSSVKHAWGDDIASILEVTPE